ncbi:PP2C family protein-serine/threonine phosphatase [Natronoglycomyces albus]|uniref:Serine/threonine-protein phosphatase n=1 Tax=Natronoglycomyces albus TaxID=2811108 RepID=A0A895XJZ8_9ACTN|nr:protein phosphatase 2C domain-containing protein [Natronoglycomyces albus]QSB05664.1 serine/threonine-protein phosphatase [Natronoglycomyces albus]
MTLNLHFAAVSHRGVVRKGNQDSVFAGKKLLAIADGMGGMAAGDLASAIVINTITRLETHADPDTDESTDPTDALADVVVESNRRLRNVVAADPSKEGMGTTLTALLFDGEWFSMIHIGDSRGYRLRSGSLEQITKDDTYVQLLIDDGRITEEEAERHPQRSMLLRALGAGEIEPAFKTMQAHLGDRFMLCSDGLSGVVPFARIEQSLLENDDPQAAADELLQLALDGGAPDNVTLLVADVVEEPVAAETVIAGAAADQLMAESDTAALPAQSPAESDIDDPFAQQATEPDETSAEEVEATEETTDEPEDKPRRRAGKVWAWIIGVLLILGLLAAGAAWYLQSQFYVGVSDEGNMAIYRGVPVEVAGVSASWLEIESQRSVDDATAEVRAELEAGISAEDLAQAEGILADLSDSSSHNDNLLPLCEVATDEEIDPDDEDDSSAQSDPITTNCRDD